MNKPKTLGGVISPILEQIENDIWAIEAAHPGVRPGFTLLGFRGATKLFMTALLDQMWNYQEKKGYTQKTREKQAEQAGNDIRKMIKKYAGIDTHSLYK